MRDIFSEVIDRLDKRVIEKIPLIKKRMSMIEQKSVQLGGRAESDMPYAGFVVTGFSDINLWKTSDTASLTMNVQLQVLNNDQYAGKNTLPIFFQTLCALKNLRATATGKWLDLDYVKNIKAPTQTLGNNENKELNVNWVSIVQLQIEIVINKADLPPLGD